MVIQTYKGKLYVLYVTAVTVECEAYEESRLLPEHDFSP